MSNEEDLLEGEQFKEYEDLEELDADAEDALLGASDEEEEIISLGLNKNSYGSNNYVEEVEYVDEEGNPVEIGENDEIEFVEFADSNDCLQEDEEDVLDLDIDADLEIENLGQDDNVVDQVRSNAQVKKIDAVSLVENVQKQQEKASLQERKSVEPNKNEEKKEGNNFEKAESSESEDELDSRRGRFKSERSNVISLSTVKKTVDIPDTLDAVIPEDVAKVAEFLNKQQDAKFARKQRGRGRGRGWHFKGQKQFGSSVTSSNLIHPNSQQKPRFPVRAERHQNSFLKPIMSQNFPHPSQPQPLIQPQAQQQQQHHHLQQPIQSHQQQPLTQHQPLSHPVQQQQQHSSQPRKILINPHFKGTTSRNEGPGAWDSNQGNQRNIPSHHSQTENFQQTPPQPPPVSQQGHHFAAGNQGFHSAQSGMNFPGNQNQFPVDRPPPPLMQTNNERPFQQIRPLIPERPPVFSVSNQINVGIDNRPNFPSQTFNEPPPPVVPYSQEMPTFSQATPFRQQNPPFQNELNRDRNFMDRQGFNSEMNFGAGKDNWRPSQQPISTIPSTNFDPFRANIRLLPSNTQINTHNWQSNQQSGNFSNPPPGFNSNNQMPGTEFPRQSGLQFRPEISISNKPNCFQQRSPGNVLTIIPTDHSNFNTIQDQQKRNNFPQKWNKQNHGQRQMNQATKRPSQSFPHGVLPKQIKLDKKLKNSSQAPKNSNIKEIPLVDNLPLSEPQFKLLPKKDNLIKIGQKPQRQLKQLRQIPSLQPKQFPMKVLSSNQATNVTPLPTTNNQVKPSEEQESGKTLLPPEDEQDEQTRILREKIEQQKKIREEVLRKKEERRRLMAEERRKELEKRKSEQAQQANQQIVQQNIQNIPAMITPQRAPINIKADNTGPKQPVPIKKPNVKQRLGMIQTKGVGPAGSQLIVRKKIVTVRKRPPPVDSSGNIIHIGSQPGGKYQVLNCNQGSTVFPVILPPTPIRNVQNKPQLVVGKLANPNQKGGFPNTQNPNIVRNPQMKGIRPKINVKHPDLIFGNRIIKNMPNRFPFPPQNPQQMNIGRPNLPLIIPNHFRPKHPGIRIKHRQQLQQQQMQQMSIKPHLQTHQPVSAPVGSKQQPTPPNLKQRLTVKKPLTARQGQGPVGHPHKEITQGVTQTNTSFVRKIVPKAGLGRGMTGSQKLNQPLKQNEANKNISQESEQQRQLKQTPSQISLKRDVVDAQQKTIKPVPADNRNTVLIENLAAATSQGLQKLCEGIGPVEKIDHTKEQRKAVVKFKNPVHAQLFMKRYHRRMMDLSLINISLLPS